MFFCTADYGGSSNPADVLHLCWMHVGGKTVIIFTIWLHVGYFVHTAIKISSFTAIFATGYLIMLSGVIKQQNKTTSTSKMFQKIKYSTTKCVSSPKPTVCGTRLKQDSHTYKHKMHKNTTVLLWTPCQSKTLPKLRLEVPAKKYRACFSARLLPPQKPFGLAEAVNATLAQNTTITASKFSASPAKHWQTNTRADARLCLRSHKKKYLFMYLPTCFCTKCTVYSTVCVFLSCCKTNVPLWQ